MPYIGNQSTNSYSSMVKQDLTGASGASVTLSHPVANANEVELYINNVRQEPTTSYTTNGTTLSFVGYTVAASDDIYVIFSGKSLQTVVPPDGSVSTAKIADSAVSTAKIADSAVSTAKIADDAVNLTSKVTGVLPVANGGTGVSSGFTYAEGTWTPVITGYGGGNTQTYSTQQGNYTRVGRLVVAHYSVRLSAKGNISGNYVHLMGMPFPNLATTTGSGIIHYVWSLGTTRDNLAWELGGGNTDRCWLTYLDGTTTGYVSTSDLGSTTGFVGTLIYITS